MKKEELGDLAAVEEDEDGEHVGLLQVEGVVEAWDGLVYGYDDDVDVFQASRNIQLNWLGPMHIMLKGGYNP